MEVRKWFQLVVGSAFFVSTIQAQEAPRAPAAPQATAVSPKEPGMGVMFGVILPGGGQFYSGRETKGLVILGLVSAMVVVSSDYTRRRDEGTRQAFVLGALGIWFAGAIMASSDARAWNREHNLTDLEPPIRHPVQPARNPEQPIQAGGEAARAADKEKAPPRFWVAGESETSKSRLANLPDDMMAAAFRRDNLDCQAALASLGTTRTAKGSGGSRVYSSCMESLGWAMRDEEFIKQHRPTFRAIVEP